MTEHATAPKRTTTRAKRPHLRAVPDLPKFTAANAKQHARAEAKVAGLKKKLDDAIAARDKLRDRDRKKLPAGEQVLVGGVIVKRTAWDYETFSLKDFKKQHKITATMRKYVTPHKGERWAVTVVRPVR
jgi:hypothetical protein